MREFRHVLATLRRLDSPAVLATLVRIEGSSYRRPGARLLLGATEVGSLSGGCLETDVRARAQRVLASAQPVLLRYDLRADRDVVWGHGLGCEGVAEVWLERIDAEPAWMGDVERLLDARRSGWLLTALADAPDQSLAAGDRCVSIARPAKFPSHVVCEPLDPAFALWLFGAGEDARALAALADRAGFDVHVVDPRPASLTPARFPNARLHARHPCDGRRGLALDVRSGAVVMTHNVERDREWLAALAGATVGYLGLLGPRPRAERLRRELAENGVDWPARLHAPVGLDLGADTPEAIALAVAAEAHAVLAGAPATALCDRSGPIHAREEAERRTA